MKILFVASESTPFAASGGLADVIGSLPAALKKASPEDDIRVIMPLYATMDAAWRSKLRFLFSKTVQLNWRRQYCGVFTVACRKVTYYFVDNEYYFKRGNLYGEFDDGERFAFFCRAVVDLLPDLDFFPDVLHANDWQSALSVIYLKQKYADLERFSDIRTVFTIHNILYQGQYGFELLNDVFDLLPSDREIVEYGDCINLLKGAIVCADRVTTVSPTYAKEILSKRFSHGLDPVLRMYQGKLSGILNGIDQTYYNPAKNQELKANFSVNRMAGKAICKAELQEKLGLPVKADTPVVAMITRLVDSKGLDLLTLAADDLLEEDVQLVLLGKGDPYYETFFASLAQRHPENCRVLLRFDQALAKQMYAGADLFLMPSRTEPCGLAQMICSRYGTVPVVHETGGLYDSIRDVGCEGGGNGFTFASYNAWDMLYAVRNGLSAYRDRDTWKKLVRRVMQTDFSWGKSAAQYQELYRSL